MLQNSGSWAEPATKRRKRKDINHLGAERYALAATTTPVHILLLETHLATTQCVSEHGRCPIKALRADFSFAVAGNLLCPGGDMSGFARYGKRYAPFNQYLFFTHVGWSCFILHSLFFI